MNVNDIDEAFEFAQRTIANAVNETLLALDKRHIPKRVVAKIQLDALRNDFDIEQIWTRLPVAERKALVFKDCILTPEEIQELKAGGYFERLDADEAEENLEKGKIRAAQQEAIKKMINERKQAAGKILSE